MKINHLNNCNCSSYCGVSVSKRGLRSSDHTIHTGFKYFAECPEGSGYFCPCHFGCVSGKLGQYRPLNRLSFPSVLIFVSNDTEIRPGSVEQPSARRPEVEDSLGVKILESERGHSRVEIKHLIAIAIRLPFDISS